MSSQKSKPMKCDAKSQHDLQLSLLDTIILKGDYAIQSTTSVLEQDSPSNFDLIELALTHQAAGNFSDAVSNYRKALELDHSLVISARAFSELVIKTGHWDLAAEFLYHALANSSDEYFWMRDLLTEAMSAYDLSFATEFAEILSELRWGSKWFKPSLKIDRFLPARVPAEALTIPKLEHDIEQFKYLRERKILGNEFLETEKLYKRVLAQLEQHENSQINNDEKSGVRETYNRIIYKRPTPRLRNALSGEWDKTEAERQYIECPPGMVVIDNFLTEEALNSLLSFCLESTVWNGTRFSFGRFGAFFQDGFSCPLLGQIAEELRQGIPKIITPMYPLREVWGFKCGETLAADSTIHADFAAVNVNFWLTPTEANLDPHSGGMVVYGIDAPEEWDWETYNGRSDMIKNYLSEHSAPVFNIPYKQNRAVIFNSDLFHATAAVNFKKGYENRRINVTMLYGDRQKDHHYPQRKPDWKDIPEPRSWRSVAFSRNRR